MSKKLTTQQEEAIKDLAASYKIDLKGNPPYGFRTKILIDKDGAKLEDIHLRNFDEFLSTNIDMTKKINIDSLNENLEMAELILLLGRSLQNGSKLKISTTYKNIKSEVVLNSPYTNLHFWYLMNTLLESTQDGTYQNDLGIQVKEKLSNESPELYRNYTDVYSDNEIEKIIQYEKDIVKKVTKFHKDRSEITIRRLINNYKEDNIFNANKKTIATNEACFLYDSLDLLRVIQGDNFASNQEKYQYIKSLLK